jgi:hypothetical protein
MAKNVPMTAPKYSNPMFEAEFRESIKGDSFPEANFLDEFLMKSSGLLSAFAPIFSEAAAPLGNSVTRNALDTVIVLRL